MTGVHSLQGFANFPASCVEVKSDQPVSCCQAFLNTPLKAQTKITIDHGVPSQQQKGASRGVFEIGSKPVAQAVLESHTSQLGLESAGVRLMWPP